MQKTELVREIKERIDKKTGRRWIQDHENTYDQAIKKYAENNKSPNKQYILGYLQDMQLGDRSKLTAKKAVSKSRCLRIFGVLTNIDNWLQQKPFQEIDKQDIQKLVLDLKEDLIISPKNNKPYAETTKASMLKMLRRFWKWLKKTPYYPEEVDWIDTYEPKTTKEVFGIDDIKLLADNCHSIQLKTILWILFDTGARINELLNIKLKDIKTPTPQEKYYTLRIRCETEKNNRERSIGLFYTNKILQTYLENHHQTPGDQESYLFTTSYDHIRNYLRRKSLKFLKKSMTPHKIRASSATHYACRIRTYQDFCYRFGWSLSSRVPDLYYNRAGVKNNDVMNSIHTFERDRIRTEFGDQLVNNKELFDENFALQRKVNNYESEIYKRQRYDTILGKLLSLPEVKSKVREIMKTELHNNKELSETNEKKLLTQQNQEGKQ